MLGLRRVAFSSLFRARLVAQHPLARHDCRAPEPLPSPAHSPQSPLFPTELARACALPASPSRDLRIEFAPQADLLSFFFCRRSFKSQSSCRSCRTTKSRTCMHGSTRVSVLQSCTRMSFALPGLVLLARPAFAPVRLTRHVSCMGLTLVSATLAAEEKHCP